MTYSQFFQGNELHRGITANGKYPHYLEKNKSFNHEEHIKGIKSQGLSPLRQKTNEEEAYCIYGGIDFDFDSYKYINTGKYQYSGIKFNKNTGLYYLI